MFNIKKQISRLYLSSIVGNLSLTGAWVALLAARGFSLVQIGLAETVFHIVSLIFEIPSGVLADVFGRKKMLMVSCCMCFIGNLLMIFSGSFFMVCLSIAFQALNYNFSSGSGDALAYDSMKYAGVESGYEKYESNQMIIYRICGGLSTLCAGLALTIGYRLAYGSDLILCGIQMGILISLKEIRVDQKKEDAQSTNMFRAIAGELAKCLKESLIFLKEGRKALALMFSNSLVGAFDILLLFFLQARLPEVGIPGWALGPALFFMELGGVVGSKLILKCKNVRYRTIFLATAAMVVTGTLLEHTGMYLIMALGGFLSAVGDDALQVRSNAILQDMFPSDQRATLISFESFTFSVVMIVLSPLAGFFFSFW
ncbi:MAG: MFS transporter [Clostridiales bacterium]|nr:MFS transporter [Candidatus Blautia equi]